MAAEGLSETEYKNESQAHIAAKRMGEDTWNNATQLYTHRCGKLDFVLSLIRLSQVPNYKTSEARGKCVITEKFGLPSIKKVSNDTTVERQGNVLSSELWMITQTRLSTSESHGIWKTKLATCQPGGTRA